MNEHQHDWLRQARERGRRARERSQQARQRLDAALDQSEAALERLHKLEIETKRRGGIRQEEAVFAQGDVPGQGEAAFRVG
ncbi:hypothetical protein FXF51_11260 [Nonomuraea sp. PA05]|uniref:hypothetical protein n=1 Tax=Nonomuraea sp. PA05 TaxID=2604466 RepID=UPI0011D3D955|nr:hypothetical protein [Nonomuraea sp. PA05]TYB68425.1 hypothetical protein FXF51_11260 [Nonomuraea sp. PA05]